ncbi:4Fe-4S ferredoxin [Thermincola ferriacetica]|uniref:4Fe-4S ferredoxin iron-sulfur binding domain protein n=2 Tax=Thermincola TaxID=278993 RepID=D5XEX8_THEPJ|nr:MULTISPECIES: 4Fe-4S dicluster domain-containing protein [Thermincola]ADG82199.1 4Fe-4S ferredoxin iron-sulfur binding domain protein [Thermincola potens JR]KNZ71217.1 4Fe-4S ferredoxin [Thermincola ferriacetica]
MGPKINADLCAGCGNCVDVCPADVFVLKDGKAQAENEGNCLECGACAEECPPQAINLEE